MTLLDPGNELHTLIEEYGYQRWREGHQTATPGAQATATPEQALSALLNRFRGILEDLADALDGDIKETVALAGYEFSPVKDDGSFGYGSNDAELDHDTYNYPEYVSAKGNYFEMKVSMAALGYS